MVQEWTGRLARRILPLADSTYRQPEFLEAWFLLHENLDEFDSRLARYSESAPEVRRATRLLLAREIERRRPGKADAVRSVALATIAPLALVGLGLWSDWSAALFAVLAESSTSSQIPESLVALFSETITPTMWAFCWVILVLLTVLYVWSIATWGADKKRGSYVAWAAAFSDYEADERRGIADHASRGGDVLSRLIGRLLRRTSG